MMAIKGALLNAPLPSTMPNSLYVKVNSALKKRIANAPEVLRVQTRPGVDTRPYHEPPRSTCRALAPDLHSAACLILSEPN
jgi:hypothetical protein